LIFNRFKSPKALDQELRDLEEKLQRLDADIEKTRDAHRVFLENHGEVKEPQKNIKFQERNDRLFNLRHSFEKRHSSLMKELERRNKKQRRRAA